MAWVIRYLGAAYAAQRSIVIPAKAGTHFVFSLRFKINMDSGFRRNDGIG